MATSGNKKKLSSGNRQLRSQDRRITENAVFSELTDLLPIPKDIQQDKLSVLRLTVAYLKLQSALESDEQDLEECLATADDSHETSGCVLDSYNESGHVPLAMLDNEGNLIAGSLNLHKNLAANTELTNSLPNKVWSDFEEQFIFGSEPKDDIEMGTRKEKFKKYKEDLEKGMEEFLNHDLSDVRCNFNNFASTKRHISENENMVYVNKSRDGKTNLSRQTDRDVCQKNKICKNAKSENKLIAKTLCYSAIPEKLDQQLALPKSIQESSVMLEAAAGFILSLDKDKQVLFVSENVSKFLGHCQLFMIGQDVSEFIYKTDYPELERQMCDTQFKGDGAGRLQPWQVRRTFYMAMKFSFMKSGSRMKDSGLQLYQWNAKLWLYKDKSTGDIRVKGLTSLCCPQLHETILSINNSANFFIVRMSIKDSRILYCDPKVQDLLGYSPNELIGIKHSDLKHPSDISMCKCNKINLPRDGKCETGYYRMLSRMGSWVWMYTNLDIIYNKDGEAEVLVMRNIIVSQGEAHCVLSREKKDFEKLQNLGYNVDLFTQGMSIPSMASIAFDKQRKKKRTSFNYLSPVSEVSAGHSKASESLSKSVSSDKTCQSNLFNENSHHIQMQGSNSPQQLQNVQKLVCTSLKNKKSGPRVKNSKSVNDKKHNSANKLLYNSQAEDNSDKIAHQTLVKQCISEDTVMDSFPISDCRSHFDSQTKSIFNLTDSDSSTEMTFSQQKIDGISLMTGSSSSLLQFSSPEQEWPLNALLFDTDLPESSLNLFTSISEVPIVQISSTSPEQTNHTIREMNSVKFINNNQLVHKSQVYVDQRNMFSSIIQSHPVSDDQSLDSVLDFLEEEPLPASKVLMTPFSGDIMLSSLTAPQSIKFKQRQQNQSFETNSSTPNFQNLTLETKCQNKQLFSGILTSEGVTSSKTKVISDHVVPVSSVYQGMDPFTLFNHKPVVAGQSGIISRSEKLDYPPLPEISENFYLRDMGTFDELEDFQGCASNAVKKGNQVEPLGGSCTQNSQRNHEGIEISGINNCIQASKIQKSDKIFHESAPRVDSDSSVSDFMLTTINEGKQSLCHVGRAKPNITSPSAGNILPGFYEELDQNACNTKKSNLVVNNMLSSMKNSIFLVSNNHSEDLTCQKECTLPEDLIDLELNSDIAVDLSEDLLKYL